LKHAGADTVDRFSELPDEVEVLSNFNEVQSAKASSITEDVTNTYDSRRLLNLRESALSCLFRLLDSE
jgi:hypothetical protein